MKLKKEENIKPLNRTAYSPLLLLFVFLLLCSHNLYIKMETYFLEVNQAATLSLYNGTFENSENIITRDRILDASFVAHGKRVAIKPEQWQDLDSTITQLSFTTGKAGTYVAGVSTKARNIALSAEEFNNYLKHDGVLDMLEYRKYHDLLERDAVESYQKHIKAIYQVGDKKTRDWSTILGYPIEFVPQANPYTKYSGEKLEVKLLLDGKPLAKQLVYAEYIKTTHTHAHSDHDHAHDEDHDHDHAEDHNHSHDEDHDHDHDEDHSHAHAEDHSHAHDEDHDHAHAEGDHSHDHDHEHGEGHGHTHGQQLRTDEQGMVSIDLPEDGIYYLRTIHMLPVNDSDELTHESKWATLTFELTHKHDSSTHTHSDHDHEGEIPTWVFVLTSLIIIGALFFMFRTKNS